MFTACPEYDLEPLLDSHPQHPQPSISVSWLNVEHVSIIVEKNKKQLMSSEIVKDQNFELSSGPGPA